MNCIFTFDNNTIINLPYNTNLSNIFITRVNSEILFRTIINYLLINKIIDGNIIDLGAWIGDNSLPWAKNTDKNIYAIDPSPENCKFIQELSQLNNINNLKIIQRAISNKHEVLYTNDDLFHVTFVESNNVKKTNGINSITSCSLDNLFEDNIIENIKFIHLDVEGMESYVIMGSINLINKYRPIIAFEQHLSTDNYYELVEYMNNIFYIVYCIDEILPGCRECCRNFISFPKEIHSTELIQTIQKITNNSLILYGKK